jgi:hypothetical protein
MNNEEKIKLSEVTRSDFLFLYKLLKLRNPKINISHKKMPSFKEHMKFVMNRPYSKWYVIYYKKKKVGSAYLTKQNEIGIHLNTNQRIYQDAIKQIMMKNPRKRYLANLSPQNMNGIKFFKKCGFTLIQQTYELDNDDVVRNK